MKKSYQEENSTITVAQLCEALANGRIPAQMEDGMYVINNRDLRQFAHAVAAPEASIANKLALNYIRKAS